MSEESLEPLDREWQAGERSLCATLKDCVTSKRILTTLVHIFYAIPPNWPRGSNWQRVPNVSMVPSIVMAVLIWMAFGIAMCKYIITEDIWTMGQNNPPLGSVLIVIFLVLSSTVSFTAVIVYLFNPRNRFRHSSTKLIPGFQFAPMGTQEDVPEIQHSSKPASSLVSPALPVPTCGDTINQWIRSIYMS
ncbi:hypothetical protein OS493_031990 [Desmophyllum pertusum]|uniref:Uncharacterized protein n=1 Tax=Desmophyllum pertusum TaxID=174260 RepID=A0A9X0CUT9_9CNID|nr:hypothetical protein OS493_031990 [Desmophyllum pertusum]